MKMNEIPEKFLEMMKYAEELLETDRSSSMAVIVTTAKGDVMGFASKFADTNRIADRIADENKFLRNLAEHGETRISCGLCIWRNGSVDVPSANLRKGLEELDVTNLKAEFLLQGGGELQLRSIGAMRPPKA